MSEILFASAALAIGVLLGLLLRPRTRSATTAPRSAAPPERANRSEPLNAADDLEHALTAVRDSGPLSARLDDPRVEQARIAPPAEQALV